MRDNIFLFTGPDNYFLRKEVAKRRDNFSQKFGAENFIHFTADNFSIQQLQEQLQGGGFFSQKKLIVCDGIPDDKITGSKAAVQVTNYLIDLLQKDGSSGQITQGPIQADVLLVFISLDPDKRGKLYKILSEKATGKTFPIPTEKERKTHIAQWLGEYDNPLITDYLLQYVGEDTDRIVAECDKIYTYLKYTNKKTLSTQELGYIVYSPLEANTFGVLDAVISGDITTALGHIDDASYDSTSRNEFIGMMYRGLKHILLTIDLYTHGTKTAKEIASVIGIHPFPIIKNLKHITYLIQKKQELMTIYHDCINCDAMIKSGRIPAEGFRVQMKKSIAVLE